MVQDGRAWVFGDRIDTDVLAPGSLMKLAPEDLARHCLAAVRPSFAEQVQPGDIVVAGAAFGVGSSREQAAISLRLLGVRAVVATSFARIFFRNAFNVGLPALTVADAGAIADGDRLALDLAAGRLENRTQGRVHAIPALPPHLMRIVDAGGLIPCLKQRLRQPESTP